MKLTEKDFRLLGFINEMNRAPLSSIAKASGFSKKQVEYRMQQYVKSGIVKFRSIYDYSRLGYDIFIALLIKLEKRESMQNLIEEFEKNHNPLLIVKTIGKYDMFVNLLYKNEKDMNEHLDPLLHDGHEIADYKIIKPTVVEKYSKNFLCPDLKRIKKGLMVGGNNKEVKLSKIEKDILKILDKNARTKIVDIAHEVNSSAPRVFQIIKKLHDEKIILASYLELDMQKLQFFASSILINVRKLTDKNKAVVSNFALSNKFVDTVSFSLGKPNFYVQIFYRRPEELLMTLNQLTDLLRGEIVTIDPLFQVEAKLYDRLPILK